jgi:hypothetical protein
VDTEKKLDYPLGIPIPGLAGDAPKSLLNPYNLKLMQALPIVKTVELKSGLIAHIRRGKVRDAVEARRMVPKDELAADPTLLLYALTAVLSEFTEKDAPADRPPRKLVYEEILEMPMDEAGDLIEAVRQVTDGNF